jgi:hypothetical protein
MVARLRDNFHPIDPADQAKHPVCVIAPFNCDGGHIAPFFERRNFTSIHR